MSSPLRSRVLLASLTLGILLTSGCASSPKASAQAVSELRFQENVQYILVRNMQIVSTVGLRGPVVLTFTLDRTGRPLACVARPMRQTDIAGPNAQRLSALLQLVQQRCLATEFPAPPETLLDERRQVEIKAPLIFADQFGARLFAT